jgi:hypothetical protein
MSRFACLARRSPRRDATSGYFLVGARRRRRRRRRRLQDLPELLVRGRVESVVEVPYEFSDACGESKMSSARRPATCGS